MKDLSKYSSFRPGFTHHSKQRVEHTDGIRVLSYQKKGYIHNPFPLSCPLQQKEKEMSGGEIFTVEERT